MSDESTLISEKENTRRSAAFSYGPWTKQADHGNAVVFYARFAVDATYWESAQLSSYFDNNCAVFWLAR